MYDKGNRKIVDNQEGEKRLKMKAYCILVKVALEMEEKRENWIKREERRKREKHRLQEAKLKLQEMEKKLKEEGELRRREREKKQK